MTSLLNRTMRQGVRAAAVLASVSILSCAVNAQTTTVTFAGDTTTNLVNPERGFYGDVYPSYVTPPQATRAITDADCAAIRNNGWSLLRMNTCLYPWYNKDISASYLQTIRNNFAAARRNGIKIIPLLQYNYAGGSFNGTGTGPNDTTAAWVTRHLDQLQPIFQENADVLAWLACGFVGQWGEWHTSFSNLLTSYPTVGTYGDDAVNADSVAIIDKYLQVVPADRQIAMRYARHIWTYLNGQYPPVAPSPLDTTTAYDGSALSRLGSEDHSFNSGANDQGTFGPNQLDANDPTNVACKNWLNQNTLYTVSEGEPYGLSEGQTAQSTLNQFQLLRFDAFNGQHDESVGAYSRSLYQRWKNQGIYNKIQNSLGYRFRLVDATFPTSVTRGQATSFSFRVANDGWGKMFNPRPLNVVLIGATTGTTYSFRVDQAKTSSDPRLWLPGTTTTVPVCLTIPADAPADFYDIHLQLPDNAAGLQGDYRYGVRFANVNDANKFWYNQTKTTSLGTLASVSWIGHGWNLN